MRKLLVVLFTLSMIAAPALAVPAAAQSASGTAAKEAQKDQDLRKEFAIAGFIVASIAILAFAWKSDVLRDSDPVDFPGVAERPAVPGANPPVPAVAAIPALKIARTFSLAQTQMTWWFWIVISSFVYLAIKNFDIAGGLTDKNSSQVLILLGIGSGTAIGAAIIDQARQDKGKALTDYNAAMSSLIDPKTDPAQVPNLYSKLLAAVGKLKSDGFFRDILSDADGISLHRFQSVAWTAVLGGIFLINVFNDGTTLPLLTTAELSLLGISAGTYLGLKIPEQQAGGSAAPPAGGAT
jgi:hypothetical protein